MDTGSERKEYIDVDDALKRVANNMDLLKKLLGRFLGGDHIEPLEEALGKGDVEESVRLAHTLKGVAANLSLIKLRDICADLEHHIKDGTPYDECLEELKQAYITTAAHINEVTG